MSCRHQIRNRLRAIALQLRLFIQSERLQVACDLMAVRRDENKAFALRALFEFEQP